MSVTIFFMEIEQKNTLDMLIKQNFIYLNSFFDIIKQNLKNKINIFVLN